MEMWHIQRVGERPGNFEEDRRKSQVQPRARACSKLADNLRADPSIPFNGIVFRKSLTSCQGESGKEVDRGR